MQKVRILIINDQPEEFRVKDAFMKSGFDSEIVIARTEEEARKFLPDASTFHMVLMDFDLGIGKSTVETGLVMAFRDAEPELPIIANSRSSSSNRELSVAGCCGEWSPSRIEDHVYEMKSAILKLINK